MATPKLRSLLLVGIVPALAPTPLAQAPPVYQYERAKLAPATLERFDRFGFLAMDADTLVVGAPRLVGGSLAGPGRAFVYERAPAGWQFVQELQASDGTPSAAFGLSLAVAGDTIAVGADGHNLGNGHGSGAVYVYRRNAGVWTEEQKLQPSTPEVESRFGRGVALEGDRLLVGAPQRDTSLPDTGAAFAFVRSGSTWQEQQVLVAPAPETGDLFATNVALAGGVAAVGAPGDGGLGTSAGAVHVFELAAGSWTYRSELVASDGMPGDLLGGAVAMSPGRIVTGAWGADAGVVDSGAAYVFESTAAGWRQQAKLMAWDATENELFGTTVAVDGLRVLVGCRQDDSVGTYSGSARLFERDDSGWHERTVLLPSDGGSPREFGHSVGLRGDWAAVGQAFDNPAGSASGSAYVFRFPAIDDGFCFGYLPDSCPCGNESHIGGCANSTGDGAVLGVGGSASVANGDLILGCFGLPRNTPSLLFAGTTIPGGGSGVLFGDGRRCVSGSVVRLGVRFATNSGNARWEPGPVGSWMPGDTRFFQVWYRDHTATVCGGFASTSNGVEVRFVP